MARKTTKQSRGRKLLKRADDIHFAQVENEFYLTLQRKPVVACISPSAFIILENLDGFTDADSVASALAKSLGTTATRVQAAVKKLCEELVKLEVLEYVRHEGQPKQGPYAFVDDATMLSGLPQLIRVWAGDVLDGGMFVNSAEGDIKVIVPNVTDGPIKTCPPHTCTIPAGLFTARTIIRRFDESRYQQYEQYERTGFVHWGV